MISPTSMRATTTYRRSSTSSVKTPSANFPLPFGVAPNFLIDGTLYAVPMVIEESSVVAAASSAAKYWSTRGGFRTSVVATEKLGQVHFRWSGHPDRQRAALLPALRQRLTEATAELTVRMEGRGGGVSRAELEAPAGGSPRLLPVAGTLRHGRQYGG